METNELIQQLASAIHHWLSYVSLCTNSNLLAESSVRYPFVEFLERKCGSSVKLEKQHDVFSKRHIDFCFENGKDYLAVELKYASKHTRSKAEKQRVYNDLIRLALIVKEDERAKGFFIMCGETQTFVVNFMNIVDGRIVKKNKLRQDKGNNTANALMPQGDYSDLFFNFERDGEKEISLTADKYSDYHRAFIKEYYEDNAVDVELGLSVIKTKRVAYLPVSNQTSQSQTVAIWEVTVIN